MAGCFRQTKMATDFKREAKWLRKLACFGHGFGHLARQEHERLALRHEETHRRLLQDSEGGFGVAG